MKVKRDKGWYFLLRDGIIICQTADSDTMFQHINRHYPIGTQVEWEITNE